MIHVEVKLSKKCVSHTILFLSIKTCITMKIKSKAMSRVTNIIYSHIFLQVFGTFHDPVGDIFDDDYWEQDNFNAFYMKKQMNVR